MKTFSRLISEQWRDGISVLLGLWLLFSPWILQFTGTPPAMWNSVILGVIIAVASGAALFQFHEWEEWIDTVMGVWLVVSPWLLGYSTMTAAAWNHVAVGLITVILSVWSIRHFRHRQAAHR